MNTILWTQNESPDIPDTILIDGKVCNNLTDSQKAFNQLNMYNNNLTLSPHDRDKLKRKYETLSVSRQLNFKVYSRGVYIQGCFMETDKVGRKLPYMFLDFTSKSVEEAAKTLKCQAEKMGRNTNQEEISLLSSISTSYRDKKTNKNKYYIFLLILLFILLLYYGIV